MKTTNTKKEIKTTGNGQVLDVTAEVVACIHESKIKHGIATMFVPGSTAGFTTIEYEAGAVKDLKACFDRLAPDNIRYAHEDTWHDGNGHSHVRAALLGPSLTIPIQDGAPLLGTWQQIVLVDFDNKQRWRTYYVNVMGE